MEQLIAQQNIVDENIIDEIENYIRLIQHHMKLSLTDKVDIVAAPLIVWRPTIGLREYKVRDQLLSHRTSGKIATISLAGDHFSIMKSPIVKHISHGLMPYWHLPEGTAEVVV